MMVLSQLPVAASLPLGLMATVSTRAVWLYRV